MGNVVVMVLYDIQEGKYMMVNGYVIIFLRSLHCLKDILLNQQIVSINIGQNQQFLKKNKRKWKGDLTGH